MKKITMKDIARELTKNDKVFETHIDPMQLALLTDKKLSEDEEEKVFEHLSQCKRCRDVLKLANELEEEDKQIQPVNNPDYKGMVKHFMPFAAAAVIFLGVPQGDKYFNDTATMKSVIVERNIFEESMHFWKKVYSKLLEAKENR